MRRFLALGAIPLLACAVLAGCGSSNVVFRVFGFRVRIRRR